ncbi:MULTISPECIES: kinase [Nocardia]|uniref:kinase n=1 Tax=Nocardia TaxID=1817 RepID=UPI0009EE4E5C|nr:MULTISPECIES: kinase [Nocardia]
MSTGVLLYGPPASGKDTVTAALSRLDPQFQLFERLKDGPGRTTGYRMISPERFDQLRDSGDLIWTNTRYRARYAIDRSGLLQLLEAGRIPVVHAGQPEAISAVVAATPAVSWTVVALRVDRDAAISRIAARATGDFAERLAAWDETPSLTSPALTIDTTRTPPDAAASLIRSTVCD